ncbi:MAG: FAD:protein FMN transferase [Candidatus Saccharimonadales bacterium]
MPITIQIVDSKVTKTDLDIAFNYFKKVDARYSTYKKDSEISKINRGLPKTKWSREMKEILLLCEDTKKVSHGYFDIRHNGKIDPSGLVKGWSIKNAADILKNKGFKNFYVDAGGDIQVSGRNEDDQPWTVGIKNPFNIEEIIKVVAVTNEGVATSGAYIRGQHIYNPKNPEDNLVVVKSLTVIGPNIYEADRFATAAYAMGVNGINFIESMPSLEGYMVKDDQTASFTSGFERYIKIA